MRFFDIKKNIQWRGWSVLLILLCIVGCSDPSAHSTPTLSPEIQAGKAVYVNNCAICHALAKDTVLRGPSFYNIANRAAQRVEGQDARTYLYNSITNPNNYVVKGFDPIMPNTYAKSLSGEDLDAVVNYLLSLVDSKE